MIKIVIYSGSRIFAYLKIRLLITKIIGLWCDVLAPLRGGGLNEPDSNYLWININAFLARLASVNVCTAGLRRVGYMCDSFIQDNDVREDALIFNTSVSAAAQYMIYSADKVFEFCEQEQTLLLRHLGWKK